MWWFGYYWLMLRCWWLGLCGLKLYMWELWYWGLFYWVWLVLGCKYFSSFGWGECNCWRWCDSCFWWDWGMNSCCLYLWVWLWLVFFGLWLVDWCRFYWFGWSFWLCWCWCVLLGCMWLFLLWRLWSWLLWWCLRCWWVFCWSMCWGWCILGLFGIGGCWGWWNCRYYLRLLLWFGLDWCLWCCCYRCVVGVWCFWCLWGLLLCWDRCVWRLIWGVEGFDFLLLCCLKWVRIFDCCCLLFGCCICFWSCLCFCMWIIVVSDFWVLNWRLCSCLMYLFGWWEVRCILWWCYCCWCIWMWWWKFY